METVVETRKLPVAGQYDVIVAGGGIAGCAAAIAARRHGHSVLLVEKTISLGGLATNGLVVLYNPSLCDRKGRRIIGGISEELLHASIAYGSSTLPKEWTFRKERIEGNAPYQTQFNMPSFICALDEIMIKEGVCLLFDTICSDIFMEDGICKGISVENKGGRCYYGCKQLIDTTGDLDLFMRAGAPCKDGLNWLSFWALSTNLEKMKECCDDNDIQKLLTINMLGTDRDGIMNPPGVRRYTIDSGEEVTKFIIRGRAYLTEYLKKMDISKEMVVQVPAQAQYRTTRYLDTDYILSEKDKNKPHEDSVGCAWTFRDGGFFIEIPYRTMKVRGYRNMLTAGRSIGSIGMACEVSRLIAPSAVSGEAAGIAASLAIDRNCDVNELDSQELQQEIIQAGGIIHF